MKDIERISVYPDHSIEETMIAIQAGSVGIALVVDKSRRLLGTITDGDIRRAILHKIPLNQKIEKLLKDRPHDYPQPIVAKAGTPHEELLVIMKEKVIRQVPLLDDDGRVVELSLLSELIEDEPPLPLTAVVMAGGKGRRLRPLTKDMPKPMLPLNNRPLMEHTIERLRKAGITKINIATNYKSEMIMNHFGKGDKFGVDIDYVTEGQPLGTAGALSLMAPPDKPVLIINGDILTQLNFRAMFDFHRTHDAVMTVGVRKYDINIPYGVIETNDVMITQLIEKPLQEFIVNAGIYLLEPMAYQYIPKGRRFDMTDLVNVLIKASHRVISFPIQEYWLDVGHHTDYKQAKIDIQNGKV